MRAFPIAKVLGLVVLIVGVAGFGRAVPASQTAPDEIAAMVDRIFATVPAEEQQSVVLKDDLERAYLAFYVSTYADVRELRAYSIPFRNVAEYVVEQKTVDDLLASGQYAEAFERLLNLMRLDLGSQYVSDVGLDGVREGDVVVGAGHMRDRFHNQVFTDHAAANQAYVHWLERALALSES
jgi:hypothetical protein